MSDKYMIVKGQRGGKVLDLAMRMAEYIRSHPHEGAVIVVTQKGLDECIKDARKKALDEVYAIALNENYDTLIEWLQNNIID